MKDTTRKAEQPMDPSAPEGSSPEYVTRQVRNAYAIETLVTEVEVAFGVVARTMGEPDEWQVIHEATLSTRGQEHLSAVLHEAARQDSRIAEVVDLPDEQVRVRINDDRTTRDLRDGFGLAEILAVFQEPDTEPDIAVEPAPASDDDIVYRSAETGRFVTEEYAEANPGTTVAEEVPDPEPEPEPVYISKASGKRVTRAWGEAHPDKVTVQ